LVYCPRYFIEKPDTLFRWLNHRDGSSDNENIVLLCSELLAIYTLKEVELEGLKRDLLSEIQYDNRTRDQEKPIVKIVHKL